MLGALFTRMTRSKMSAAKKRLFFNKKQTERTDFNECQFCSLKVAQLEYTEAFQLKSLIILL